MEASKDKASLPTLARMFSQKAAGHECGGDKTRFPNAQSLDWALDSLDDGFYFF